LGLSGVEDYVYETCLGLREALYVTARLLCQLARQLGFCELADGGEPPLEDAAILVEEAGLDPPAPMPSLVSSCSGVLDALALLGRAADTIGVELLVRPL